MESNEERKRKGRAPGIAGAAGFPAVFACACAAWYLSFKDTLDPAGKYCTCDVTILSTPSTGGLSMPGTAVFNTFKYPSRVAHAPLMASTRLSGVWTSPR